MKYTLPRQAEEDLIQVYQYGQKVFVPLQAEKYHGSLEKTLIGLLKILRCTLWLAIFEKVTDIVFIPHIPYSHSRGSDQDCG